jgi:Family of unknown function (DUF6998)
MNNNEPILEILQEAKKVAQRYRAATGKPLGITGEVAEYEAARILDIELTPARQAGYDATEKATGHRLQIKGRCLLPGYKPGQRLGSIDRQKEWDAVLMVLMDENYDVLEIWEAPRAQVLAALNTPGSKARNERGSLPVTKFKSIGKLRWSRLCAAAACVPPVDVKVLVITGDISSAFLSGMDGTSDVSIISGRNAGCQGTVDRDQVLPSPKAN